MQFHGIQKVLLLIVTSLFLSCSMVKSVGISTTASMLKEGIAETNTEANFHFFEKAAPANLKMLESLWFVQQDNTDLLSVLIKGYGGYGFGISETKYLADALADEEESKFKKQALYHYSKAFNYGLKYLEERGISSKSIFDKDAPIKLKKELDSNLSEEDMTAIFYFAQSWAGMINLQRDNVAMMSRLGTAKALMDWVCRQDMSFELGSCYLFYAAYEAGRPAMLGGSLEKGKKLFEKLIAKYPYNLLARVAYIQYYIIPTMNEGLYAKESNFLKNEFKKFEGVRNYANKKDSTSKYLKHPEFNLFNSIAIERLNIIEKYKEDIF